MSRLSECGKFLITTSSKSHTILVRSTSEDAVVIKTKGYSADTFEDEEGTCFVLISIGKQVITVDAITGEEGERSFKIPRGVGKCTAVRAIASFRDTLRVALGFDSGHIGLWTSCGKQNEWTVLDTNLTSPVSCFAHFKQSSASYLASGHRSGQVQIFKLQNKKSVRVTTCKLEHGMDSLHFDCAHGRTRRICIQLWASNNSRNLISDPLIVRVDGRDAQVDASQWNWRQPPRSDCVLISTHVVAGYGICALWRSNSGSSVFVTLGSDMLSTDTSHKREHEVVFKPISGTCLRSNDWTRLQVRFLDITPDHVILRDHVETLCTSSASSATTLQEKLVTVRHVARSLGAPKKTYESEIEALNFLADSGLLAKLTQSVRDLESNSKSIILSWIMRRLEDCEKEKMSSCHKDLCLSREQMLFSLQRLTRALVRNIQDDVEGSSTVKRDLAAFQRYHEMQCKAYVLAHRYALSRFVLENKMAYDANRLRRTYESRRRNEDDQLFIERVVSTLDSEATTRPFPPDRFEDLVSSLFQAVMESMSNETGSFEESGETVLTLFMSHALFVIMYVCFDCIPDDPENTAQKFASMFFQISESLTTVITSLWRLDAEVDVPRATQKLLGTRPDHSIRVEILRTLLNRNLEHDALKFMRVAEFPPSNEDEKELAIRVYLKCGLWQEALYRQREYVRSSSKKDEVRSTLVPLILEHVYVNRAAPQQNRGQVQDDEDKMDEDDEVVQHCSVLDLPLNEKEGEILISFLERKTDRGDHRAADILVSLHLHHCRINDALAIHERHREIVVSSSLSDALRQRIQTRRVLIEAYHATSRPAGSAISIAKDNVPKNNNNNKSTTSLSKKTPKIAFGESGIYSPGLFSLKDSPLVKRTLPSSRRAPTPYMKAAKNRFREKEKEIMSLKDDEDMDVAVEESNEKVLFGTPQRGVRRHDLRLKAAPFESFGSPVVPSLIDEDTKSTTYAGRTRSGRRFRSGSRRSGR